MWLLATNGLIHILWGLASRHFRRKFLPLTPSGILNDAVLGRRFNAFDSIDYAPEVDPGFKR
jgi:thiosulfate reductase cytochrome b subunit